MKILLTLAFSVFASSALFAQEGKLPGEDRSTEERYRASLKGSAKSEADVNQIGCQECVHRMADGQVGMLDKTTAFPGKSNSPTGNDTDGTR